LARRADGGRLRSADSDGWLIEGLLQYLDEDAVWMLFDHVHTVSAAGSVLLYDVVGRTLLESQPMKPLLQSMAEQGSPWLFGTGDPAGRHSDREINNATSAYRAQ
jgi:O-methyltransferase involved in polyketide biosynthesis